MEFFLDPSTWIGLLTLITLEVVLGIDNLVFIAILTKKLPPSQRDKARIIGLSLALLMRLNLLLLISWIVTLTTPIIQTKYFVLSGRDLLLLSGGLFLIFKATIELHERLENYPENNSSNKNYASLWAVIIQIIVLDAVFSLDAIVTAVGIVNNLPIMMTAVIISMTIMSFASKFLTNYINHHQSVILLCLSFLLMIGFNLVAGAFQIHIPKGYIYATIGFSIMIELFNQISYNNFIKNQSRRSMRQRTAEAILRLMIKENPEEKNNLPEKTDKNNLKINFSNTNLSETFKEEERYMMNGVLTLGMRSIKSMMTPRGEISWVNLEKSINEIRCQLLATPHSLFPVCKGELDEIIGVVRAKELLFEIEKKMNLIEFSSKNPPIIIPDTLDPINLLKVLRKSKGKLAIITNEFGVVQGLITPLDILEAIAGEFPDEDETPEIISENDSWLVKGGTDLHSLEQLLNTKELIKKEENHVSLAGLLISQKGQLPSPGEIISIPPFQFHIIEATEYRINLVRIKKNVISKKEKLFQK
ncbi:TerC family protein [Buchnera aphidicola (Mindarus keteleerifoliae)]|uniref:TerC family protein n=1 Tax=Buchnera aphidicola TaxID=9 RepID=UPI0031B73B81